MGVFDKVKRAFGFDAEIDDVDIADDDTEAASATHDTADATQPVAASPALRSQRRVNGMSRPSPVIIPKNDSASADAIFEHVVAVFNQALPDFLQKSVDPAAQRRLLYDSLTADLKAYVDASRSAAEAQCRRNYEQEKTKLQANIREMEARYSQYNTVRDEMQQKLMSSERQRRALTERNRDLENQIAALEAEREQFQLENKSLVNKLKVADVKGNDSMQAEAELNALRGQLNDAKAELLRLRQQPRTQPDSDGALDAIVAAAVKSAREETEKKLRAEMEAETKRRVDQACAEARQGQENSADRLRQAKDAEISELKKQLDEANARAEGLQQTVSLNTDMQARTERVHKEEMEKLKGEMQRMAREAEALKAQLSQTQEKPEREAHEPRRNTKRPRSLENSRNLKAPSLVSTPAPLDDILSDTDWLVSPSAVSNAREEKPRDKGRHQRPSGDDSQLSLF